MQRPDWMELADAAEQKDSRKLWMDQRISGRSLVGVPVGTGVGGLVGTAEVQSFSSLRLPPLPRGLPRCFLPLPRGLAL